MQKLKILGICEHSSQPFAVVVWDAVSGWTTSFESLHQSKNFFRRQCLAGTADWCFVCRSPKEIGGRPVGEHSPRSQSGRAVEHRNIGQHLGTTCWADAGLRMPNVTTAGQSRELMHTGMQLPYLEGPPSTTHSVAAAGAPRGTGHDTPRKAILFDYSLYIWSQKNSMKLMKLMKLAKLTIALGSFSSCTACYRM